MTTPTFFIVGAPKCGTTALYHYLSSHPSVFLTRVKEPTFFGTDFRSDRSLQCLEDYQAIFRAATPQHRAIGEASVAYLASDDAIADVRRLYPDARIVAMLRNPVKMAYSLHSQMVFNGWEHVTRFEEAWRLCDERSAGNHISRRCTDSKYLQYGHMCEVGRQVQRLLSIFPRHQVHLVLFDDFVSDTHSVYEEVLKFLGIPSDSRHHFPPVNENRSLRMPLVSALWQRTFEKQMPLVNSLKETLGISSFGIGRALFRLNQHKTRVRPQLDSSFERALQEFFAVDVAQLSATLERDLQHWLPDVDLTKHIDDIQIRQAAEARVA